MSAELGIYAAIRLFTTLTGTLSALPGGTGVPEVPRIDVNRPGYEITLKDAEGAYYGTSISPAPLRVKLSDLPHHFINAVIAAEDKRFLEHPGFDAKGTLAAFRDTLAGTTRGGSGIAQQMIKNTMVGPDRSLTRKGVEAMLAVRAVDTFGHKEVLRRYLQTSWFGRGRTGVASAPEVWFGKTWDQVTIAESATLAAMLKGPGRYDPWRNPDLVQGRRDAVLNIMHEQSWITAEELEKAKAEPVTAISPPQEHVPDHWVQSAAKRELQSATFSGIATSTLTVDAQWQAIAQEALRETVSKLSPVEPPKTLTKDELEVLSNLPDDRALPARYELPLPAGSAYKSYVILKKHESLFTVVGPAGRVSDVKVEHDHSSWKPSVGEVISGMLHAESKVLQARLKTQVEGAVVAIDPRSGEIIATIGGVDPNLTWFDRTVAMRSPGSAIKPMLYLAALDMGYTPQSGIKDQDRTYYSNGQAWRPRNYDRRFHGSVPVHTALERSLNAATVDLANSIGIDAMASTAERAGVYDEGQMRRILPSALGTSETSLARLVSGYAAIINDATPRKRHIIREVAPEFGEPVRTDIRLGMGPIASPAAVNDLLGMLRGVVTRGTASVAMKKSPVMVAAKTGTSQDHKDAWFISVTPHLALGVWLGRDDNKPLPGTSTGGATSAPIAVEILKQAHAAGLITDDGYRDERMSSGTPWPPNPHAELPRGQSDHDQMNDAGSDELYDRNDSTLQDDIDALLSDLNGEMSFSEPPALPASLGIESGPVDRNGDLLNLLR